MRSRTSRARLPRTPDLLPARAALGQALLQTGKAEEAIPLLEGAISADQDGSVHFQLFRAYQLTHRETEARQALADYQRFRASLAAAALSAEGSVTSSTWFVLTFRNVWRIPLGHRISIRSTSFRCPAPKCTPKWLEEA